MKSDGAKPTATALKRIRATTPPKVTPPGRIADLEARHPDNQIPF